MMRKSKQNIQTLRKRLFDMPEKLQPVKCYLMFCDKCGKIVYSEANESRYDFIEELYKEGWMLNKSHTVENPAYCPECREGMKSVE